jgi:hypothetical protein
MMGAGVIGIVGVIVEVFVGVIGVVGVTVMMIIVLVGTDAHFPWRGAIYFYRPVLGNWGSTFPRAN